MSAQPINYEELVASYEDRLLNQLRGHGVDLEFLEMWVPDEDSIVSILNMAEAAGAFGTEAFSVCVSEQTLPAGKRSTLQSTLEEISSVEIEDGKGHCIVHIRDIKA